MPDENDIQKLLRLKRYEQPPPEYFEHFLRDFQHRQRAEILREPLWKIALHRLQAFFSEPSMTSFAYAGATAAVLLVAGMVSLEIINGDATPSSNNTIAVQTFAPTSDRLPQNQGGIPQGSMTLEPRIRLADWGTFPNRTVYPAAHTAVENPHYVIDARPVSYEPPSSF